MPAYQPNPLLKQLTVLQPGVPEYLYGIRPGDISSPAKLYITSVAIATNVATVAYTVYEGNVPAVGSLISIQGTQTSSGVFNVTNAVITAVTPTTAATGTLTFALTNANVSTTADAGIAVVPLPIVYETVVAGSSRAVASSNNSFGGDLDRTVSVQALFGALPTAVTVTLQGSNVDMDSAYVNCGTIATVASSAVTANGLVFIGQYLFYRANTSGLTGSGTLAVVIEA